MAFWDNLRKVIEQVSQMQTNASVPVSAPSPKPASSHNSQWTSIPTEECSFNFNGSYVQYFSKVFNEEFPAYRIECEVLKNRPAAVFTFWQDGRKALVVEIISQNGTPKKLRRECEMAKTPYLRYYHDHWGWWNTRSYVVNRTRAALGG